MKNNQKQESKQQSKIFVQPSQFKYQTGIILKPKKKSVILSPFQGSPLNILAQKLKLKANIQSHIKQEEFGSNQRQQEQQISQQIYAKTQREIQSEKKWEQYQKMIAPRDTLFKPSRSVFNRYNYENYENYVYSNPYKPKSKSIITTLSDRIEKEPKSKPYHGTQKGLEIVFCERRYKQFVQKSNMDLRGRNSLSTFSQIKSKDEENGKQIKHKNISNKKNSSKTLTRHSSMNPRHTCFSLKSSVPSPSPSISPSPRLLRNKTTLAHYLQQYTTLEKLSQYVQRQHKLNQKYLLLSNSDPSRSVLLQVFIHRFTFLQKMKRKGKQILIRIILGDQSMRPMFKINIQQYIKFIQIFIARDADTSLVGNVIFNYLFDMGKHFSIQNALNSLDLIGNTVVKHKIIEQRLKQMFQYKKVEKSQIIQSFLQTKSSHIATPQKIYSILEQDINLQNLFIDLIVSAK